MGARGLSPAPAATVVPVPPRCWSFQLPPRAWDGGGAGSGSLSLHLLQLFPGRVLTAQPHQLLAGLATELIQRHTSLWGHRDRSPSPLSSISLTEKPNPSKHRGPPGPPLAWLLSGFLPSWGLGEARENSPRRWSPRSRCCALAEREQLCGPTAPGTKCGAGPWAEDARPCRQHAGTGSLSRRWLRTRRRG